MRVVRDKATNLGKGFGYVMFRDKGAVKAAVALDGLKLRGRKLRVARVRGLPAFARLPLGQSRGRAAAGAAAAAAAGVGWRRAMPGPQPLERCGRP